MGSNCTGLDGKSTVLQVPVGTALYDQETGELVHDFSEPDERARRRQGRARGDGAISTSPPAPTRLRASTSWAARARSGYTGWN